MPKSEHDALKEIADRFGSEAGPPTLEDPAEAMDEAGGDTGDVAPVRALLEEPGFEVVPRLRRRTDEIIGGSESYR